MVTFVSMKVVRCSDDTYAVILQHAARRGTNITRAVDELVTGTGSSLEQGEGLATLKRVDELELQTRALLGLLHRYHLAAHNAAENEFYCHRCGEGLMDWVEESRNPEGVIDWQAYQCSSCGWAFQI